MSELLEDLNECHDRVDILEAELAEWESAWGNVSAELANAEAELAEMRQQRNDMLQEITTWQYRAEKSDERLAEMRHTHVKVWEECPDCPTNGDSDCLTCIDGLVLADGVHQVERYLSHHVLLLADSFTVEHPITCNLTACDVYTRCSNEWEGPPAPPGWYLIDVDTLELAEAEEREIAYVIPAEWLEAE